MSTSVYLQTSRGQGTGGVQERGEGREFCGGHYSAMQTLFVRSNTVVCRLLRTELLPANRLLCGCGVGEQLCQLVREVLQVTLCHPVREVLQVTGLWRGGRGGLGSPPPGRPHGCTGSSNVTQRAEPSCASHSRNFVATASPSLQRLPDVG